jgi:hypothetical protein
VAFRGDDRVGAGADEVTVGVTSGLLDDVALGLLTQFHPVLRRLVQGCLVRCGVESAVEFGGCGSVLGTAEGGVDRVLPEQLPGAGAQVVGVAQEPECAGRAIAARV